MGKLGDLNERNHIMPVNVFDIRALKALVAAGYKSTTYALAELVDNAFDAGANKVRIIFLETPMESGRKKVSEILVVVGKGRIYLDLRTTVDGPTWAQGLSHWLVF